MREGLGNLRAQEAALVAKREESETKKVRNHSAIIQLLVEELQRDLELKRDEGNFAAAARHIEDLHAQSQGANEAIASNLEQLAAAKAKCDSAGVVVDKLCATQDECFAAVTQEIERRLRAQTELVETMLQDHHRWVCVCVWVILYMFYHF